MDVPLADGLDERKLAFIDVNGIRTRYYDDGDGEPVVLIHGGEFGMLAALDCWSLNLPGLAREVRVIAVDLLGQGYTDNPRTAADYAMPTLLAHLRGVLDRLGIERAHLVGHSRGALHATCLALDTPSRAKSLMIVDSSTAAPDRAEFPLGVWYDALARRIPPGPPTLESVRIGPEAQSHSTAHVTESYVSRPLAIAQLEKTEAARRALAENKAAWLTSMNQHRAEVVRTIREAGIPAPTMVVWGRDDPSAPLPLGIDLYQLICEKTPRTELHVFNQAGHYSYREHPEAFNRLALAFWHGVVADDCSSAAPIAAPEFDIHAREVDGARRCL